MAFRIASVSGGGGSAESFTPTVTFATPGTSSISYGTQSGTYVKVGSVYLFTISLEFTPTIGTGSGNIRVAGLPATASVESVVSLGDIDVDWDIEAGDGLSPYGIIRAATSYFEVATMHVPGSSSVVQATELTNAAQHVLSATGILFA